MNDLAIIRRSIYTSYRMYIAQFPLMYQVTTLIPRMMFQLAFFTLIGHYIGGSELSEYVIVGNSVFLMVTRLIVLIPNQIQMDIVTNIFESIVITPSRKFPVYFGKSIVFIIEGVINSALALTIAIMINENFEFNSLFLPVLLVLIFMSVGVSFLGLLIGIFSSKSNMSIIVSNITGMIMLLICGVNFNSIILPKFLQIFSSCLPFTNGLKSIRYFLSNDFYSGSNYMMKEFAIMIIYGLLSCFFVNRLEKVYRKGDY